MRRWLLILACVLLWMPTQARGQVGVILSEDFDAYPPGAVGSSAGGWLATPTGTAMVNGVNGWPGLGGLGAGGIFCGPDPCTTSIVSTSGHNGTTTNVLRQTFSGTFLDPVTHQPNDTNDSAIAYYHAPVSDIYERYWVRLSCIPGQLPCDAVLPDAFSNGGQKDHYFNNDTSPNFYTMFGQDGTHQMTLVNQTAVNHLCPPGTNSNDGGFNNPAGGPTCNLNPPNLSTTPQITFNVWYCVEGHLGQIVAEQWINGVQIASWPTATGTLFPSSYHKFEIFRQAGDNMIRDEDDLVLATTRIGCGTAPSSPFALIQTIAAIGGQVTSYADTGLTPTTGYCYRSNNQDAAANPGPYSPTVCATTPAQTTGTPTRRTLATDTFARADAGTLGGNWTSVFGSSLAIVSQTVHVATVGQSEREYYNAQVLPPNQWAQVTIPAFTQADNEEVILLLRFDGVSHGYSVHARTSNLGNTLVLRRQDPATLSPNLKVDATATWHAGDVLLATMVGTTLCAYQNAILITCVDDSVFVSGNFAGLEMTTTGSTADLAVYQFGIGDFGAGLVRTTIASDAFVRADENPLSGAGVWTGGYGLLGGNLQLVSHAVQNTVADDSLMAYTAAAWPNDQWCQMTVTPGITTVASEGCVVRAQGTPTASFIVCLARAQSGFSSAIRVYTNGTSGANLSPSTNQTWVPGDVLLCQVQGSVITMFKNGSPVISATDSTYASGVPGLFIQTNATLTNWSGGSFAQQVTPLPIIASAVADTTGATLTYGPTTPSFIRVQTGSNIGAIPATNLVYPLAALSTRAAATFSDTMTRANAGSLGGNYTATLLGMPTLTIVSNAAQSVGSPGQGGNIATASAPNDQWASLTLANWAGSANQFADLYVRVQPAGNSAYFCEARRDGTGATGSSAMIWRVDNTINTQLATVAATIATNDVLACQVIGTTINFSQNGTVLLTVSDSTYTSGSIGFSIVIISGPDTALTYKNFSMGGFTSIGRFTVPGGGWPFRTDFAGFFAQDITGAESQNANDHLFVSLAGLTQTPDLTPPVLTLCGPAGTISTTQTTQTISCTSDEAATLQYATSDIAYASMTNRMTTVDSLHHSAQVAVSNGNTYDFYVRGADLQPTPNVDTSSQHIHFVVSNADVTAPTAPANASCVPFSSSQATCTYTPGTDAVGVTGNQAKIGIQVAGVCTPSLLVNPTWTTAPVQQLVNLTPNTVYCLTIQAFDAAGLLSPVSNQTSFTTPPLPDQVPPSNVPGCLSGSATLNSLVIACQSATDNIGVQSYDWARCTGAGCTNFDVRFNTVTPTLPDNSGLLQGTTYCYVVSARDFAGNSSLAFSSPVCGTTLSLPTGTAQGLLPSQNRHKQ